jgi:cupin fold WbuC family metalloprotein
MEEIFCNKALVCVIVRKVKNGTTPITNSKEPLQLIAHKHSKNTYIKGHVHSPKKRTTKKLQECISVIKGKIKVRLFSSNKKFLKNVYLSAGQVILLIDGGWSVEALENSEFVEIKNGPFIEDKVIIE